METPVATPATALPTPDYDNVPRGNTQKHVNREVLRYLLERSGLSSASRVLDLSCGDGELLTLLRRYWPQAVLAGSDIRPTAPPVPGLYFQQADLSQPFEIQPQGGPFDLVTSVSGVMMFGNTRTFIASAARHVRPGGQLLVTNDNILTVRDRVSYFFTGRVRRFKLLFEADEKLTQLVQHQELKRLLEIHGLEVKEVFYTSFYAEDLLYLPLALLVYPIQWLYLRSVKSSTPQVLRQQMFGFKSLLCRHYVMIAHRQKA